MLWKDPSSIQLLQNLYYLMPFLIFRFSIFRGVRENQLRGGGRLPKKDGGLGQFADLREGERWGKEGGGCGLARKKGGLIPRCTL